MATGSDKKKDAWDKAQIVSGLLSSVVIAGVGLLINNSIQRAQIEASRQAADSQKHIEEGTLTEKLMDTLGGENPLKKRLAIVVLERSVPPDMYQDVISMVVKSDTDPEVRITALEQARKLRDVGPSVAQAIAAAASDVTRSERERELANDATQQIGLNSISSDNTYILASSDTQELSLEEPALSRGVFTYALIEGLDNISVKDKEGNIRLKKLDWFITQRAMALSNGLQRPILTSPSSDDDPILFGPSAPYNNYVCVAIGNSKYLNHDLDLKFSAKDADSFVNKLNRMQLNAKIKTKLLTDAQKGQMLDALHDAAVQSTQDTLEIVYYSGHAYTSNDGRSWLLGSDAIADAVPDRMGATSISAGEMKSILSRSPARTVVVFIDATLSGAIAASR